MHAKTKIALATALVVFAGSDAMAQSLARYSNDAPRAANQEIIEDGSPLTRVAAHRSPRSGHFRQSRNAGLRNGGQAPESQYDRRGPLDFNDSDDNYQYWRQACCL